MKLSKREKYSVAAASAAVVIFILLQFVFFPLMDKRDLLERNLEAKRSALKEIMELKAEYDAMVIQAERIRKKFATQEKGFTLFSFLDNLAGQVEIKEYITSMKPSVSEEKEGQYKLSMVEMKIQGINMKKLSPYLYLIETSKNAVYIKRISIIKAGDDEGFIDALLQVETIEI